MKKLIVSGALLGLAATPALAADMKIYGQAHLAGSYLDNGASGAAKYSALNISSNSSYLGFRANYDFNEHLRGIAQIEGDVNFDGEGDNAIYSRNTFLGLGGAWGEVKIGRMDTPLKVLRSRVDLFGNQVGDARNVMAGSFDNRFKRSILYTSPTFYGLTADLHYSTETEKRGGAVDGNDNDAWSASLTYRQGPLYAAVAYEQWNYQDKADKAKERDATRVAVSYNIADVVRITGFAHFASYEQREDANTYGIGVRYALTPQVALKAQYYTLDSDANNADADLIAVGVDYQAAKNLRFYLNYAQVSNDENTRNDENTSLAPWRSGSTLNKVSGVSDETAKAVAVGAILSF